MDQDLRVLSLGIHTWIDFPSAEALMALSNKFSDRLLPGGAG